MSKLGKNIGSYYTIMLFFKCIVDYIYASSGLTPLYHALVLLCNQIMCRLAQLAFIHAHARIRFFSVRQ